MDTLAIPRTVFFVSDGFGIEPKVYARAGSKKRTYSGVAVFRSGTFRDSRGVQNTWEDVHLKQMLDNYNHLKSKNILPSVPVRDGHPGFLVAGLQGKGNVVGWHENIEVKKLKSPVDGKEYDYLLADYTITEDYAQEKLDNGTWRNRSAEIGFYTTNDEAEFWPVYVGFAFVDFPAVEGLNFSSSQGRLFVFTNSAFGVDISKEKSVGDEANANQGAGSAANTNLLFSPPMVSANGSASGSNQTVQQGQAQAQQVTQAQPFVFSVNGQNVTDPAEVQGHINRMEQYIREVRESSRKAFVSSLAERNLIAATQIEGLEAFALSLNDEQYEAWKKQWEFASPPALLAVHSTGGAGAQLQPGTKANDELDVAKEIVKMHMRNNMPLEQLKQTPSYQRLIKAGIDPDTI